MSEARSLIPESNARDARGGGQKKAIVGVLGWVALFSAVYFVTRGELRGMRVALLWLPAAGLVATFIGVMAVNMIRFRRELLRYNRDAIAGLAALARGDLKRAHDTFWAWAERTQVPSIAALARHNLAWTLMRQGNLPQAIAVATDNDDRNSGVMTEIGLFPMSGADLALYHALQGDTVAAEQWMTKTEQRSRLLTVTSTAAMKAYARAVLDCRAGKHEDAARQLDEHWAEYEAMSDGAVLRPLRIVRAFAIAASGPRSAGIADTMIALSRPVYPGEYDFLGVAWPEMAAFLASHGLSRGVIGERDEAAAS